MTVHPPDTSGIGAPEDPTGAHEPPRQPLLERLGMAAIALVLALLFGGMAVASWIGGEGFLAIMAGIGALMTAWAGVRTVLRG
jgi:hypothetical protein